MDVVPQGIAPQNAPQKVTRQSEPRWPALVAMLAVGGIFYALPPALKVGPDWLVLVVVVLLVTPGTFLHSRGLYVPAHIIGYTALGAVTLAMIVSLLLLVFRLPLHKETPSQLLRAAVALWSSNVLVFASWYWRLDAGGPHQRDLRGSHTDGAFLFPQMTLSPRLRKEMGEDQWSPHFVDYLFLAFNTSTAFSPTDVPVLSRWAKALMMVQAAIALATLAVLAARAVNIL
jgi:hypothetical protein